MITDNSTSNLAPPSSEKNLSAVAAPDKPDESFAIVGIGASAGGLEAVTELLSSLPAASGMAFLLAQHLDPHHASFLVEILAKKTAMPVRQATEGAAVEPNHLYVIPPNTSMRISQGRLTLRPRGETLGPPMPIDDLLHSLAEDQGANAIGVILSGSGSDGALAMQTIKGEGGITFAQDDESAHFTGMPRAAVSLGCVDFVLSPQDIGRELARLGAHPYLAPLTRKASVDSVAADEESFKRVFASLKSGCDIDFTHYKRGTIARRLDRRMAMHNLETLREYATFLEATPSEVEALGQDLLIRVTEFFRDPDTFDALAKSVFPRLLTAHSSKTPIRIWVPGCASGEEVYSIAICLLEYLGERAGRTPIQIFGSDVNAAAVETARAGLYLENIARDVSAERLRRFFVQIGNQYRVAQSVRDLCIFARQDVTQDPPFSKLDLVSCRNLLIYLNPVLQKRVIQLFHYALNPEGVLMLGSSESIGTFSDMFSPLDDKRFKLYAKKLLPVRTQIDFLGERTARREPELITKPDVATGPMQPGMEPGHSVIAAREADLLRRTADRIALARYAPAGVLCDEELNILEFRGDTAAFLAHPPGSPSLNLNKLVRPELLAELAAAIREARRDAAPVRKTGLWIAALGQRREVSLEIIPVRRAPTESGWFLIFFEEILSVRLIEAPPAGLMASLSARVRGGAKARAQAARHAEREHEVAQLTRELDATRLHVRTITEEFETAREQLQSAQEELLSSNEEFQSTNEELETAKEELQSTNEELATTNDELRQRNVELNELNGELQQARDYSRAIVETVREPLLILDGDLRVVNANRAFYTMFKTRPAVTEHCLLYELGESGNRNWDIPALRRQLDEVLPTSSAFADFEVSHVFPGIGEKTMRLNATRLAWAGHALILLAMEDDTERLAAFDALKQADRRKDEFLAMLAHELRGPLAPIRNALEIWRGGNASEDALRHAQAIIDRQLRKATRLVDDLLDMSRITSGAIAFKKEPVDLVRIARQAVESTSHLFDARRQKLTLNLPSAGMVVEGDATRLEQIVSNLLSNAAKYTKRNGRIALRLEPQGEEAVLAIVDDGIGIAPDLLPVIFDLFTQGERSLDRTLGGLGIGLSLVRRLTQMHGGTVTAASKGVTLGSTFTLRIPLLIGAVPVSAPPLASPAAPATPRRILVVDDNVDSTESLTLLLQSEGHDVRAALDGHTAIAAAITFLPQVVLLDIGLPDMDGLEVARHLRLRPETKQVLMIALTGYAQPEDRQHCLDAGFDHHVVKPLDFERLRTLIAGSAAV